MNKLKNLEGQKDTKNLKYIIRTALKELLERSLGGSEDTQQAVLDIISKTKPDIAWKFFRRNYSKYFEVRLRQVFLACSNRISISNFIDSNLISLLIS